MNVSILFMECKLHSYHCKIRQKVKWKSLVLIFTYINSPHPHLQKKKKKSIQNGWDKMIKMINWSQCHVSDLILNASSEITILSNQIVFIHCLFLEDEKKNPNKTNAFALKDWYSINIQQIFLLHFYPTKIYFFLLNDNSSIQDILFSGKKKKQKMEKPSG